MREIIFRGKQRNLAHEQFPQKYPNREREFVYGTGVYDDGVNLWLILENGENKPFSQLKSTIIDPDTLGQFSGLRDNKRTAEFPEGQRIFKGDLFNFDGGIARVEWCNDLACYLAVFADENDVMLHAISHRCAVIGNIHEHRNLLGGEVD